MHLTRTVCFGLLTLATSAAWSACDPVRVAYVDQERPPYYLGSGDVVASPPGASVELIREIVGSAGCAVKLSRLPFLRMRTALESRLIDAAPLTAEGNDDMRFAFPLDKAGKPDPARAMRMHTILFVRASDKPARGTDPLRLLAGNRVGIMHGAVIKQSLRAAGAQVDDGAVDIPRNLEKLRLGRVNVFAVSLIAPTDMDAEVARYGGEIVRIEKPAQTVNLWLAFSKAYYAENRAQVDSMWQWIGVNGEARFAGVMRKYMSFR